MYGMIHRALRQMVVEKAGLHAWHEIEKKIEAGPDQMVSVVVYDDAKTLQIVDAVSRQLDLSPAETLKQFGRFWIEFVQCKPFGAVLKMAGSDLASCLRNLDRLHSAVLTAMPNARIPSFTVIAASDGQLDVRYQSQRTGLEPFIVGLFQGLLDKFGLTGNIEVLDPQENLGGGKDAVKFRIRYSDRDDSITPAAG